jgi:nucleoside-triphosphatase THEP1
MCCMMKKILLTGRPGCGKTTLIQRVVKDLALPAGGFYTEEIRQRGVRVGFKVVTLDAKRVSLPMLISKHLSASESTGLISPNWKPLVLRQLAKQCIRADLWS